MQRFVKSGCHTLKIRHMQPNRLKLPLFLLLAFSLLYASCKKEGGLAPVVNDVVLPAGGAPVINATNYFALDFLNTVLQKDASDKNKMVSPLSIYLAISMVYNGADHATKDAIQNALR